MLFRRVVWLNKVLFFIVYDFVKLFWLVKCRFEIGIVILGMSDVIVLKFILYLDCWKYDIWYSCVKGSLILMYFYMFDFLSNVSKF